MPDHARLLTLKEAARLCGVHRHTFRKWVRLGRIAPVILDGRPWFRRDHVESLCQHGRASVD